MAYDIPGAVHVKIERPTMLAMAREGLIAGVKDSSGDEANFRGLVMDARAACPASPPSPAPNCL